jgi:hypothetical protein
MSDDSGAVAAFLAAAVIFGFIFPHKGEAKDKTIYLTYCIDGKHSTDDCPKYLTAFEEKKFRIFPEQKTVVEQLGFSFIRYGDCTILDVENWECPLSGKVMYGVKFSDNDTGSVRLLGGNYTNTDDAYVSEGIHAPKAGEQPFLPIVQQQSWIIWSVERELYYRQG